MYDLVKDKWSNALIKCIISSLNAIEAWESHSLGIDSFNIGNKDVLEDYDELKIQAKVYYDQSIKEKRERMNLELMNSEQVREIKKLKE